MKVKQAELVAKAEVKAAAKKELELAKAAKVIAEVPALEIKLEKYKAMVAKVEAELAEAKVAADLVEKARLAQILADAEADEAKEA
jgi:beta-galactosidase GanA